MSHSLHSEKIEGIDRFEVEGAARTLKEAAEIQGNKKLLAAAKKQMEKEIAMIHKAQQSIGIEKKAEKKMKDIGM